MKQLKFRFWSKVKKSWLNSCVVGDSGVPLLVFVEVDDNNVVHNKVYSLDNLDPVIQQYTGLKDREGKEIYEGDIVEDKRTYYTVEWSRSGWDPFQYSGGGESDADVVKVVGNIFENDELFNIKSRQ